MAGGCDRYRRSGPGPAVPRVTEKRAADGLPFPDRRDIFLFTTKEMVKRNGLPVAGPAKAGPHHQEAVSPSAGEKPPAAIAGERRTHARRWGEPTLGSPQRRGSLGRNPPAAITMRAEAGAVRACARARAYARARACW